MNSKIVVLLSTYNGEKYIKEQVDSILKQTYKNIVIYIRDDGSTDNTKDILSQYNSNKKVNIEYGKNIGFIKSFFWLIKHSEESNYYAFSDQDDVWFTTKIEMALQKLNNSNESLPTLYFSNYDYVDSNLTFLSHNKVITHEPSFTNSIVDCMPLGFNIVFNKEAHKLMQQNTPNHSCGHDWWTYMICAGFGKIIYDSRPTVYYRRHNNNVSAGGMSFIKFQIWRFRKFFKNNYFNNIKLQIKEYYSLYYDKLSAEDQKLLGYFTNEHYNFSNMMHKLFYKKRFRQTLIDEILIRLLFIIGKL